MEVIEMVTLTIRDVPEEQVQALKERAQKNRRSMQAELLVILDQVLQTRAQALQQIEESWQNQNRSTKSKEIESWLKASRP